jgi:predicted DsbA family dithiol-disulfide isomerase
VPYELHPEIPPGGRAREEVLPEGYRARIEAGLNRLSAQVGLELKNHERLINSRPALQAAEFARAAGLFEPMHRGLFEAYWLEGRDVSDLGVLREVGTRVRLDVDAMEAVVRANTYGEYLDARRAEALDLMISGIPAHVIAERYLVMGAQPYPVFEQVMAKVGASRRTSQDG